jgi:hypothetical protein
MKTSAKLWGIIALLVLIGFVVTACESGNQNGNGNNDLTGNITVTPNINVIIHTKLTAVYSGNETVNYQWEKDEIAINGETNTDYTPTVAGKYTVTVSAKGYNSKTSAPVTVEEVSFESFSLSSIYVDNKSGERLVAFKNTLSLSTLISGIPAYAYNHGLAKSNSVNNSLFITTGDFVLILITEAQYNQNKNNLAAAAVFAELYAFYNHETANNNSFQISSRSGGTGSIVVTNPTSRNIEIRKNGPTGEVLGYVLAHTVNKVIWLNTPDTYDLYPVFKKYVPGEKEIFTIVPMYTSGALERKPYSKDFALSAADSTASWNLSELKELDFTLTSGSFFLRIVNNSATAVRFTRADEELLTSMGIKGIAPGSTNVYSVSILRNPDGTYPELWEFSNLKIGTQQNMLAVPANSYKLDYVYTITVTGADASNLVLGTITESENPLDIEAIFGF